MIEFTELEQQIAKGLRTEAFVNSNEYTEAVQAVYQNLLQQLTVTQDMEQVLELKRYIDSLQGIDSQLRNFIEDGYIAQKEIDDE